MSLERKIACFYNTSVYGFSWMCYLNKFKMLSLGGLLDLSFWNTVAVIQSLSVF